MSLTIKAVYTKRMNYSSENTPVAFFKHKGFNQNLELNFNINKLDDVNYEIVMVSVVKIFGEDNESVAQVFVEKGALFEIKDIPEADLDEVLNVNLPSVLFPYLRQEVENIVHYSGFPPFHIQPISFYEIYQNKKSKE